MNEQDLIEIAKSKFIDISIKDSEIERIQKIYNITMDQKRSYTEKEKESILDTIMTDVFNGKSTNVEILRSFSENKHLTYFENFMKEDDASRLYEALEKENVPLDALRGIKSFVSHELQNRYGGILFGKSTRGFVAASPNKSLVGFIGGIAGSVASGCLFKYFFSEIITISYPRLIILGIITSLAAIIGDLIESVFKRSCNVKDSGTLIPGRGGVLDSIDSLLIAAPIFYIGYNFLF